MQEVSCDADENLDNDESGMEVQPDDSWELLWQETEFWAAFVILRTLSLVFNG